VARRPAWRNGRSAGPAATWLAEATRALVRVVEQCYADGTGGMQAALRAAAEMRASSDAEAVRREAELAGREAALRQVLTRLDKAQAGQEHRRPFRKIALVSERTVIPGLPADGYRPSSLPVTNGSPPGCPG